MTAHPELTNLTPLAYLLGVMRDPSIDAARRDRAAALCAPFVHPRMYDNRFSKADEKAERARRAAGGKFKAPPAPNITGLSLVPKRPEDDG